MNTLTETPRLVRLPSRLWLGLAAWFTLAVVAGTSGLTSDPRFAPALLAAGVTLPPLTGYLAWRSIPGVRRWVSDLDLQALIALHSIRTVGLGFILLSLQGQLHPAFAWPAGIGDAIAALTALVISINLAQGRTVAATRIRSWNRFGMLDFVVAVAAGFLLRSALLGDATSNTDLMGSIPLALFPLFAVPLMFLVHMAIAVKLKDAALD